MTTITLDDDISRLERLITSASEREKEKIAERLRALLTPKRSAPTVTTDTADEDDLFNNMPV